MNHIPCSYPVGTPDWIRAVGRDARRRRPPAETGGCPAPPTPALGQASSQAPWIFDLLVPRVLAKLQRSYPSAPLPRSPADLDSVELGCGAWGCAYDLGDVVFKLTTSPHESQWARAQLADGSLDATQGMANVFAVASVPVRAPFRWLGSERLLVTAIWREKADAIGQFYRMVPTGSLQADALSVYEMEFLAWAEAELDSHGKGRAIGTKRIKDAVAQALDAFNPLYEREWLVEALVQDEILSAPPKQRFRIAKALALAYVEQIAEHPLLPDLRHVARSIAHHARNGIWITDVHDGNLGLANRPWGPTWIAIDPDLHPRLS